MQEKVEGKCQALPLRAQSSINTGAFYCVFASQKLEKETVVAPSLTKGLDSVRVIHSGTKDYI